MNMRKLVAALVLGGLLGSVFITQSAQAKAHKPRKASGSYSTPAVGGLGVGGGNCSIGAGCVEFSTKASEKTITVTITDASGQPVFASVSQDKATGDGVHQTVHVA